jgi:hypothetical protein
MTCSWKELIQHGLDFVFFRQWTVMDGIVYNVTAFLKDHPGGSSIVLPHLGTDITEVFQDEDYHVHRSAFPGQKRLDDWTLACTLDCSSVMCIPSPQKLGCTWRTSECVGEISRMHAHYNFVALSLILIFRNKVDMSTHASANAALHL